MTTDELLTRFQGVRKASGGYSAICPAHEDRNASLSITTAGDGKTLVHCHAGCSPAAILGKIGLTFKDIFSANGDARPKGKPRIVATYDYRGADGTVLYQAVRYEPKDFRQRRPKPDGGWDWKVKGVPLVPYRLPELLAADQAATVYVAEGEKDVDALVKLGLVATTNVGGAGKWRPEYNEHLAHRQVAIPPDNDDAGRKHAHQVATALHGTAASVKVIELPGLPEKGDVSDWLAAGGTAEQLQALVDAASEVTVEQAAEWSKAKATPADPGRPIIIVGTDESRVIDQAINALATRENVYQRGGCLVHVVEGAKTPRGIARPKDAPRIATMRFARIRELLADAAAWFRVSDEEEPEPIHPPDWVVKGIDARGQWQGICRLEAVVESPILRADGTVLQAAGYDQSTGIIFRPEGTFPTIREKPSRADAIRARDMLLEAVEDFPFGSNVHKAAWLAGTLTPLGRYAFHGPAPLFLYDANVRGCGKSLLTDVTSIITAGRAMARMSLPRDDDETRKRITALAVAGEPEILIDNLPAGGFGSPSLDAALTATSWSDRILGQSAMASGIPLYATWYATGNNVILVGDTARRVVHIRLESPEENPEERADFHHPDLLAWAKQERPKLTTAAVTVLAAYCAAGRPDMRLTPWGSFEAWSALIRQAIAWVDLPDPAATRTELASQADREAVALRQLIAGWEKMDPAGVGMTVAAVLRELAENPNCYDTLRAALCELAPPRDGKTLNPRSVGAKMHHLRRRVIGEKYLDRRDTNQGAVWKVRGSDSRDSSDSTREYAAHGRTHTRENLQATDNTVTTTTTVTACPHSNVTETPTHDGYVNRQCRDCGVNLACRRQDQPT